MARFADACAIRAADDTGAIAGVADRRRSNLKGRLLLGEHLWQAVRANR
jgi:hypothetical protein